jgi:mannose-6-phosphate isomerase-like protein (cupin superfamily)
MKKAIFRSLNDIKSITTSHGIGEKHVFLENEEVLSNLTQTAIGSLKKGECIERHIHPTMEEYYYFLSGSASFDIEENTFICEAGSFVYIPCNTKHQLSTDSSVGFLYWGVAINELY